MHSALSQRLQLLLSGLLLLIAVTTTGCRGCGTVKGSGGEVHGFVYTDFPDSRAPQGKRKAFIPGINIYLKNAATGAESSKVVTNIRGWYAIPHMTAGKYDICWEGGGYVAGCTPKDQRITIQSSTVAPLPLAVTPRSPVIMGRVLFPGNFPCLAQDPFFGLNSVSKVTLVAANGNAINNPVFADDLGDFVVPGAPSSGQFRVRAECDGITAEVSSPASDSMQKPLMLELPNVNPRIVSLIAGRGSRSTRRAELGAVLPVTVKVQNASERRLHYRWFSSVPDPSFVSRDSATVEWKLSTAKALNTLYVLVTDEKGGHSIGQVNVFGGGPEVLFSGTVVEAAGPVLPGAVVSINGHRTTTSAQGYFLIQLATGSNQYVLNISKNGYAFFSKILGGEFVGATFSLVKSQTLTVDATHDIVVSQSFRDQNRKGAELQIPANSLVDARGRPPSGPLSISISTIDLHDPIGRLPGNFGGRSTGSQGVRLSSYGGVDVQIRDSSNNAYNLARGKTAILSIPADPAVKTPPGALPFWFYNPQTGLWDQQGSAKFTEGFYKGEIHHLSSINVAFASSDAACIALNVDPASVGNSPFSLSIAFADSTGVSHTTTATVDPLTPPGTVAELPPNEPVTLTIGTLELAKQTVNSGSATPGTANPDPSPTSCGAVADLAVAPTNALGYGPLSTSVGFLDYYGLDDDLTASTYYSIIDPAATAGQGTISSSSSTATSSSCGTTVPADVCVTGTGTTFVKSVQPGQIISAAGQVRTVSSITDNTDLVVFSPFSPVFSGVTYQVVGAKYSLPTFMAQNGWTGPDTAAATYFNANDLGFGRSMHMYKSGSNIVYYVSNYPNVEQARLQTASGGLGSGSGLIATVAMEYSPVSSEGSAFTKFYVFNANGDRVNGANLDQRGFKYVPRLCIICHGGTPAMGTDSAVIAQMTSTQGNFGSRFIGFDLSSYGYSGFASNTTPPSCFISAAGATTFTYSRSNQEECFRQLNQGVLENTNPSAAQQQLLPGWYNSGGSSIDTAVTSATISSSGLVRSGNVVTVTCTSACGVSSGNVIGIFGSTSATGNTFFDVTSAIATSTGPSATSFTFPQNAANDNGGGGTVFVGVEFDGFIPAGSGSAGTGWNTSTPVTGGTTPPNTFYLDFQRTSCRTCHVDRDPAIDWNTFNSGSIYAPAGFVQYGPLIGPYVCGDRIMPHAKVTYINFWMNSTAASNPNRVQEMLNAGLDQLPATAPCPLE